MFKKMKIVLWLCGLIFILSSVQARSIPGHRPINKLGTDAQGRDLWGYAQVWDDLDPSSSGLLCNFDNQAPSPYPNIPPRQNEFGGYSGNSMGIFNPIPGGRPPARNQFGGYTANEGYLPFTNQGLYPNTQNQVGGRYPGSGIGGGIAQLPYQELNNQVGGYPIISPEVVPSGQFGGSTYDENLGQVGSAGGSQFNNANSNSESTNFQQNKESSSLASGQNFGINGGTNQGLYGGFDQVVSGEGINANSESVSQNSASGQSGSVYGANGLFMVGLPTFGGIRGQVNSPSFSIPLNFSPSDKESTRLEQDKLSSSSPSGQNFGATNLGYLGGQVVIPLKVNLGQVVSSQGSNFKTGNSNKESTNLQQNKQSSSSNSGQNYGAYGSTGGNYYGRKNLGEVDEGGVESRVIRPGIVPGVPSPLVLGSMTYADYLNAQREQTLQKNKESSSINSGSNFGAVHGGAGQVVSAGGSTFNNANSNKESTKLEQDKSSSSSASGQNFGATDLGYSLGEQVVIPLKVNLGQVVSSQGSNFSNANSNKEPTNLQQNKEVSSSSSGQSGQIISGALNKTPYVVVPLYQAVSAEGTKFQNSNAQKESTKVQQEKESSSTSQGSQGSLVSGRALRETAGPNPGGYGYPKPRSPLKYVDPVIRDTSNAPSYSAPDPCAKCAQRNLNRYLYLGRSSIN